MSDKEMALGFSSLMDLASLDTSDLKAQVSRLQTAGIYIIELTKSGFIEQPPQDPADPMNYQLAREGNILFFKAEKDEDVNQEEGMLGRVMKERYFVYGQQIKDTIQLLMGQYKQAGLKHKGVLGGVEGSAPGWIDEALGKRIAVRVRHYTSKDGQDRASYDWLSPKQLEKAGIEWEVLARSYEDENGEAVDLENVK